MCVQLRGVDTTPLSTHFHIVDHDATCHDHCCLPAHGHQLKGCQTDRAPSGVNSA